MDRLGFRISAFGFPSCPHSTENSEAELEGVSRVGSIPRSHSKEAVLDAIRADKEQFQRTGIPKYRNLNDLAAEMGIARTRLATEYKEALAYRTGPTNWALRHPRPKAPVRKPRADEDWGDWTYRGRKIH